MGTWDEKVPTLADGTYHNLFDDMYHILADDMSHTYLLLRGENLELVSRHVLFRK